MSAWVGCQLIVPGHGGRIDAGVSPLGGLHLHIELPATAQALPISAALPP